MTNKYDELAADVADVKAQLEPFETAEQELLAQREALLKNEIQPKQGENSFTLSFISRKNKQASSDAVSLSDIDEALQNLRDERKALVESLNLSGKIHDVTMNFYYGHNKPITAAEQALADLTDKFIEDSRKVLENIQIERQEDGEMVREFDDFARSIDRRDSIQRDQGLSGIYGIPSLENDFSEAIQKILETYGYPEYTIILFKF